MYNTYCIHMVQINRMNFSRDSSRDSVKKDLPLICTKYMEKPDYVCVCMHACVYVYMYVNHAPKFGARIMCMHADKH